ncbi:MAG TPA: AAA-associated domain-containing protein [Stellaceae bacterium]|nr:AAA-associated domain-containing protein [Stellaceae bacterium]
MTANAPGSQRQKRLVQDLSELDSLARDLKRELANINDETFQPQLAAVIETASALSAAHKTEPKAMVADDLAGLLSAVRALEIPYQDPVLGPTDTIRRLRASKGLLITNLIDALDTASSMGLHPRQSPLPLEAVGSIARAEISGLLKALSHRLSEVEKSLNALDRARDDTRPFKQEAGLLSFYVGSMRVEIDLARLQLAVGEHAVDFSALARVVETMGTLTADFVATIRAWGGKVSTAVAGTASEMNKRVRNVTKGVRTVIQWVIRRQRDYVLPRQIQHIGYRLPAASIQQLVGLLDAISSSPYSGRADLPRLSQSEHIDEDALLVLIEALQLLGFIRVVGSDVTATEAGRAFYKSDLMQRKHLFARHLLLLIPLAAHIRKVLEERPNHVAPEGRFLAELEDYLDEEEAREVLETVINWGRYAEIFAYDYDRGFLSLENPIDGV